MSYKPPFTINEKTINLVAEIMEAVTKLTLDEVEGINPKLRRNNRIKTIQASLAIENNSLSIDQVTAILNGKWILGPGQDIREVQNAYQAYELLLDFDPYDVSSLLQAHNILMSGLTNEAGMFRSGGVGIFAGENLIHVAPPASLVPEQISELLSWALNSKMHPLIKSCVFHYELEFIHPFADGNGRIGRMWQTLILYKWKSLFGWLPVETFVKDRQDNYYRVLGECDRVADSGKFVEFMLESIYAALLEISSTEQVGVQVTEQVERILKAIGEDTISGKELMERVGLKHRPTFRKNYLLPAIESGYLEMTIPDKPNSSKQKYCKTKV